MAHTTKEKVKYAKELESIEEQVPTSDAVSPTESKGYRYVRKDVTFAELLADAKKRAAFIFVFVALASCANAQTSRLLQSSNGKTSKDSIAAQLASNQKVTIPIGINGKQYVAVSPNSVTQTYNTGDLLYCSSFTHNWLSALAIGSPGNYIGISGGLPHWQNIDASEIPNAVLNNPDGTTYLTHNDIQPTVDVAPLRLENFATGTADLFDVHSNETGPGFVFWLSHNGQAHIYPSSDATTLQINSSNAGTSDLLRGTKRNGGGTGTNVYTLSYLGGVTQSDNLSVGPVSAWLGSAYLTVHASGHIVADTGLLAGTNTSRGILELTDGSSGFAAHINGPSSAMAGDIDWYWPSADGSSGQFLKTDGSGNLSWATPAGSGSWTTVSVSGSDFTTSSTSLVDITGLSFVASASTTYEIDAWLDVLEDAGSTGITFGVNSTGSSPTVALQMSGSGNSPNNYQALCIIANNTPSVAMAVTANSEPFIHIQGYIKSGTGTPTISIRCAKLTSGTATIKLGSKFNYRAQ